MGVLGKDLFDLGRPRTHIKVQFGAMAYWVEDNPSPLPYGATLTELLNYNGKIILPSLDFETLRSEEKVSELIAYEQERSLHLQMRILETYLQAGENITPIQERYTWFLEELFRDTISEKKKGQRKKPLADQIYAQCLDAFVSGVSLGKSSEVDAPQVNVQYAILEREDGSHELVEKMYFDHLEDFIYVEFMKGLQRGFVPKRCANCGCWFLQEPGITYNYCAKIAPGETELSCRDIGSKISFREKVKNNEVWQIHQRAYKKYFARTKKGTMSKAEFESWAREAEELRDRALIKYEGAKDSEVRKNIAKEVKRQINIL